MSSHRGGRRDLPCRNTRPSRRSAASPSGKSLRPSHIPAKTKAAVGGKTGANVNAKLDVSCVPGPSVTTVDGAVGRRSPAALGSPHVTGSSQKTVKTPSNPSPQVRALREGESCAGDKESSKKTSTSSRTQSLTLPRHSGLQPLRQAQKEISGPVPVHPRSAAHHTVSQETSHVSPQQVNKQQQKRRVLQHQRSSSDVSNSRSVSPDRQPVAAHRRNEWDSASDQSRSSTPDCLKQQSRCRLVKQSSSSDDTGAERFDILWRLRSDEFKKESPLAGTQGHSKVELHTAKPPTKLMCAGRQYSLDSVLSSPEKPQLSFKSMLTLCRNGGGAGGNRGTKLRRQKEVSVEEEDEVEASRPDGSSVWPSLTVTHCSPDGRAPKSPTTTTSRNGMQVKSQSLDRNKDSDWESHLLQVLDANAASASSSPCTTPDGRRPSLLRRLKSLSRVTRQKSINDDYGKGKRSRRRQRR